MVHRQCLPAGSSHGARGRAGGRALYDENAPSGERVSLQYVRLGGHVHPPPPTGDCWEQACQPSPTEDSKLPSLRQVSVESWEEVTHHGSLGCRRGSRRMKKFCP